MPYQSDKQRRMFEGCRNNPESMSGKCPPRKVLNEFHRAEYGHPEVRKAHHEKQRRGPVQYH